jgi:hypothetical protein
MDAEIGNRAHRERLSVIQGELRHRLRPVCLTMPDEMFIEMIDSMASMQLKYELQLPVPSEP